MNDKRLITTISSLLFLIVTIFSGFSNAYVYPTNVKTISSDYGPRTFILQGNRVTGWHEGLDFSMPEGTPIKPIERGEASNIEIDRHPCDRLHVDGCKRIGSGNVITIESYDTDYGEYEILYKHLPGAIDVIKDEKNLQYGFYKYTDPESEKTYQLYYKYDYSTKVPSYYKSNRIEEKVSINYIINTTSIERIADTLFAGENEIFAYSGNTGASNNPHLHITVKDISANKIINPLRILPFKNIYMLVPSIAYPTITQGRDYYTPDQGAKEITIRANVNSTGDFDLNKVEFLIDTKNPPEALTHKISFDPREHADNDQIFVFTSDPVAKTGCYPQNNGDDDFAYKWDIIGKSGDYYVQVRATEIQQNCGKDCTYLSNVLHIKLGIKTKVQVIDSETNQPVEGATVTLSNTQLAYNDTETTAAGTVVAGLAAASFYGASAELLPPGTAVFENLQPNTTYNVLIKKEGYDDSNQDTITTNDSIITPAEDNQTIALQLKPKPAYVIILQDTTTTDNSPVEYNYYQGPCSYRIRHWDTRFQTLQGRFVGYRLERIEQISFTNLVSVKFYINDKLVPNGIWTKALDAQGETPSRWKIVLNQDSTISYSAPVEMKVKVGYQQYIRELLFFEIKQPPVGYPTGGVWQSTAVSESPNSCEDTCSLCYPSRLYFSRGQINQAWFRFLPMDKFKIISVNDRPYDSQYITPWWNWTFLDGGCLEVNEYGYCVHSLWHSYCILDRAYGSNRSGYSEALLENAYSYSPFPDFMSLNFKAIIEPNINNYEKSILKELGMPEQPRTILSTNLSASQ